MAEVEEFGIFYLHFLLIFFFILDIPFAPTKQAHICCVFCCYWYGCSKVNRCFLMSEVFHVSFGCIPMLDKDRFGWNGLSLIGPTGCMMPGALLPGNAPSVCPYTSSDFQVWVPENVCCMMCTVAASTWKHSDSKLWSPAVSRNCFWKEIDIVHGSLPSLISY